MTIQINIGDHVSSERDFIQFPKKHLSTMRWVRWKAIWITKNIHSADAYFRTLPNRKRLTTLLADNTIWINYHPTSSALGLTNYAGGKEIAISNKAFKIGRWTVLATLIHELAHVNGVRGSVTPLAAERAVLECGLGKRSELTSGIDDPQTPYNPTIRG